MDSRRSAGKNRTVHGRDARALLRWGRGTRRDFPWRQERDPYRLVVTELMLVRTRAEQVSRLWRAFFETFPTLRSLADADEREVAIAIRPLGLDWRNRRILDFARAAVVVPDWLDSLGSLPGAGPYVVAAAKTGIVGRGPMPVDVTIARVVARYFGIQVTGEARRDQQILEAARLMGRRSRNYFHAWLDLAALICTPKAPACRECPIREGCRSSTARDEMPEPAVGSTRSGR